MHKASFEKQQGKTVTAAHDEPLDNGFLLSVICHVELQLDAMRLWEWREGEGLRRKRWTRTLINTRFLTSLRLRVYHYGQLIQEDVEQNQPHEQTEPQMMWGKDVFPLFTKSVGATTVVIGLHGLGASADKHWLTTKKYSKLARASIGRELCEQRHLKPIEKRALKDVKQVQLFFPKYLTLDLQS